MTALRVLILSFLIPDEFSLTLGSLVLSGYRIVLLGLTPYLVWILLIRGKKTDWNQCDLLALLIFIWPVLSFGMNTGFAAAVESGGILTLEMAAPYLLVRLFVNSYESRKEFANILFLMVSILFFLGLPEAITGQHYTHQIAAKLTGQVYSAEPEQRFGIWRALGPTDHAILFGTLCASITAIAFVMAQRKKKYSLSVIFAGSGAIFSASSAPILAVLVQFFMLAWTTLMKRHSNRWWILLFLFLITYIVVDIISNRDPIRVMFSYLLLNPETGYARYYMWINSFVVVKQSTWGLFFGYGYDLNIFDVIENFYWRNLMKNTVDSYWLVLMLRHGITMLILFSLFVILIFRRTLRLSHGLSERKDRRLIQAWFISAFAMTLIATTVHFWGQIACVYMMILAACVGESLPKKRRERANHCPTKNSSYHIRRRWVDR